MTSGLAQMDRPVARGPGGGILNAMTVDVEDYYHAHALEAFFTRDTWPSLERRVEANTRVLLDLFEERQIRATFFTLGTVAREFPGLIRDIVGREHELASHGLEHRRASDQDSAAFRRDVTEAKKALEDAGGVAVTGYRAASFSIGERNWWAFDVLEEAGYSYSSSISTAKLIGGHVAAPAGPFIPGTGTLVEFPITTARILGRDLPTGGGYFRLAPYGMFRRALNSAQAREGRPAIFYVHPWEIDPDQPQADVPARTRFRHRVNLARMKAKLARLAADFEWGTMRDAFGLASPETATRAERISS